MSAPTIVPGVRAVAALLESAPHRLQSVLVHGRPAGRRLAVLEALAARGIPIQQVSARRLDGLAGDAAHQGLIALAEPLEYADWGALIAAPDPLILALDQVTDPHNFGAMLRSVEAFGGTGALVTRNRCVALGPTVTKTSAGASELVPVARETNLARALRDGQAAGLQVVAAAFGGLAPEAIDWRAPTILVVGSEERGVRQLTRKVADVVVSIPLPGVTESLNAAVAVGILMHAAARQRADAAPVVASR